MDNLNNIPNAGNWGDAASKLNDNFNKVKQAVTTVENTSKNNKGYFTSLSALNTAFPSPKAGQTAYVYDEESSTNYYIYNAVNGVWVASSIEAPSVGVDISEYTKTGGSTKTTKYIDDIKANHGYDSSPKTLKQVEDNASVKIENLITNGDFSNGTTTGWGGTYANLLAENNSMKITANSSTQDLARASRNLGKVNDTVFYTRAKFTVNDYGLLNIAIVVRDGTGGEVKIDKKVLNPIMGETYELSAMYNTGSLVSDLQIFLQFTHPSGSILGKSVNVTKIMSINVSYIFGAGNEPTEEEMNLLLDIAGISYIDDEVIIPAQKVMQWQQQTLKQVDDDLVQLAGDVIHKSIGKNKLNLKSENFLEGRYLDSGAGIGVNVAYCVTDFIEINSGQSFIKNGLTNTGIYTAYYDENRTYISGSAFSNSNLIPYYPGSKYFRTTILANQKHTIQIELGTEPTEFSDYTELFDTVSNDSLKDNSVTESKLADLSVSAEKINFGAVTEAKTNFLIPTKNLFNKDADDVAFDFYVSWASGNLQPNSTYNTTGFIPIVPGQTYTRSYEHQTAFYGLNKVYVSGLNSGSSPTFVAPANAYFVRCTVAKTAWETFQLEEGSESTGYVPYGYYLPEKYLPVVAPVFANDIVTPKKQYLLSNYENSIYFKALVRRWRPDYEFVRIEGGEWSNMKKLARITNPTVETATVNARIYDLDFEAVVSGKFAVQIGNIATDNGAVKGIYIGDSLTYNGGYILKVNALLPNISWDGMRKSYAGEIYGEGRGGWGLSTYFATIHSSATDSFTPFMHPIDPYKYYGGTAFWSAVVNGGSEYGNNGFIAKATEIGFDAITGLLTTPATNDCMWNDNNGRYERWNGSAWVEITEATLNFSFNFAKYRSTWMIDQPDVVTVMLGTNDFRSQASESAIDGFWNEWKTRMDTLCASVIADSPSAKIAILLPPTDCGSLDNNGNHFTVKQTAMMWYARKKIINDFDDRESEGVYLVDVGRSVDPDYGFDEIYQTPFSDYNGTEKRYVHSNVPHPGADGYKQLGIPLAGWIQKVR